MSSRLPTDYSDFLLRCNGGIPPRTELSVSEFPDVKFKVGRFKGIGPGHGFNPQATQASRDWLPSTAFLIGNIRSDLQPGPTYLIMPTGDDKCIYAVDLVTADLESLAIEPACAVGKGVFRLGNSFIDFLSKLHT